MNQDSDGLPQVDKTASHATSLAIARNPESSLEMLAALVPLGDAFTAIHVVKHPNASAQLIEDILNYPYDELSKNRIKHSAFMNPNVSPDILRKAWSPQLPVNSPLVEWVVQSPAATSELLGDVGIDLVSKAASHQGDLSSISKLSGMLFGNAKLTQADMGRILESMISQLSADSDRAVAMAQPLASKYAEKMTPEALELLAGLQSRTVDAHLVQRAEIFTSTKAITTIFKTGGPLSRNRLFKNLSMDSLVLLTDDVLEVMSEPDIKKALRAIDGLADQSVVTRAAADGVLRLDQLVTKMHKTLGELLLAEGCTAVYQAIQAGMLQQQIMQNATGQENADGQQPVPRRRLQL
ncbi:hypothetical protein V0242_24360 (plasmid) [Aeromonas hydrophila]|uniref:hypothetical protein n=1 Tax=Aeromonas hydrophila TaxID=644 RepID=UPI002ED39C46|nr:hypothetical protein V0242_24360 [Aeromonas hydrophila]